MAKKKDDQQLSVQELLEARVDAMMDPRPPAKTAETKPADDLEPVPAPDEAAAHTDVEEPSEDLPPLDIFADKGAPALPKKLKTVADPEPAAEPAPTKSSRKAAREPAIPEEPEAEVPNEPDLPAADSKASETNTALDDAKSDAAVDDIVAQEGDVVLAAEDAGVARAQRAADAAEPKAKRGHPIFWFLITMAVIVIIATVLVVTVPSISDRLSN